MHATFLRRKLLGKTSTTHIAATLNGDHESVGSCVVGRGDVCDVIRNDHIDKINSDTVLIRWGTTSTSSIPLSRQLNKSYAISTVSDKRGFRIKCMENDPDIVPPTTWSGAECIWPTEEAYPVVVRPARHSRGSDFLVADNEEEYEDIVDNLGDWYASKFIDKVAEFRVYVGNNRVLNVAQKEVDDPSQQCWNLSMGGTYSTVKWSEWNMNVVDVALRAFKLTGLDFSGIDVILDRDGKAYVTEANSAPTIKGPYRTGVFAKYFKYTLDNQTWGDNSFPAVTNPETFHGVIHPCMTNT